MATRAISPSRALIAQRFRALRIDSGMSASVVAGALDIPRSTINSIETGRHLPNVVVCGILCAFYDAPVDFILTGTGLNRQLKMPRAAEIMLKQIMTPIDLHEPKPAGKSGFLTLKVAKLPPAEFDLKRILLRKKPEVESIIKSMRPTSRPSRKAEIQAEPIKAAIISLPKQPKTKTKRQAKKPKFDLKKSGLLDV